MRRRGASAIVLSLLAVGLAYAAFDALFVQPKVRASVAYQSRPHAILDKATTAIELHKLEHGRYPTTEEGLPLLVAKGLLKEVPIDRWGRPLNYRSPSKRPGAAFELWSFGADGTEGGTGDNRDIGTWDDA